MFELIQYPVFFNDLINKLNSEQVNKRLSISEELLTLIINITQRPIEVCNWKYF